jgi:hypothetical protein
MFSPLTRLISLDSGRLGFHADRQRNAHALIAPCLAHVFTLVVSSSFRAADLGRAPSTVGTCLAMSRATRSNLSAVLRSKSSSSSGVLISTKVATSRSDLRLTRPSGYLFAGPTPALCQDPQERRMAHV